MNDVEEELTDVLGRRAATVVIRPELDRVVADAADADAGTSVLSLQRGPRRRTARSIALAAAAAVAVLMGASAAVLRDGGDEATQPLVASTPSALGLVDGFGEWRALASAPAGLASGITHGSELSDGRILFWGLNAAWTPGDSPEAVNGQAEPEGPRPTPVSVAIYSPSGDGWSMVDTAGVADAEILSTRIAGDRLLLVGSRMDGTNMVATYDPVEDRWTESTVPGTRREMFDGVAWTGELAVLVRLHQGTGDEEVPDWVGTHPSGGDPEVWRWTPSDDEWTEGSAPPLESRGHGGWAFDGKRLATVGGVDAEDLESGQGAESTGAIYDVDDDEWTVLPDAPWPAMHPELAWDGDRLVYVAGTLGSSISATTIVNRQASWSEIDGWQERPSSPGNGLDPTIPDTMRLTHPRGADDEGIDEPGRPVLAASDAQVSGVATVGSVYIDGDWEEVPIGDPMTIWWGDRLVATSNSGIGAVDPFKVAVRVAAAQWVEAAPSPVSDLWGPAVVVVGDHLYVVGTPRASLWQDIDPVSQAWVLDLDG